MLTFDQALSQLLVAACAVSETSSVPTLAAAGRVLAQLQRAPIDAPPLDNSAMDGYAVAVADVRSVPARPAGGAAHPGRQRRYSAAAGNGRPDFHRRSDPGRRRRGGDAGALRTRDRRK
jgi:molybdopterin molybdotransferase